MTFSRMMLLAVVCLYCVHHHQAVSMTMAKRFLLPYGFGYYCDCKSQEALTSKFCRYDCPWLHRRGGKPLSTKRDMRQAEDMEMLAGGVLREAPECDCYSGERNSWRSPKCWLMCRTT
ncbi:uncharacterized protein [Branchiostoma lanceolatum]|uniref:uncharacterized protein n=1 Tax=Branchiostoma lanceolatum TaxID=7740 RepID=UPI0034513005